jgi:DnaJ homolog subfamily C member 1
MRLFWYTILIVVPFVTAWESFEPDLFDLVEEVGENFYSFFGVEKNVDSNAIRKAYRQLSLKYHPDKNQESDAEDRFRKIVGVYEVLKDDIKRKRYDQILEFGLPDWKQPIYYYRRARKLNILELIVTIGIVVIIGHFFVMWAQYFEKRLCLDEQLSEARRKLEKKQKKKNGKSTNMDEIDRNLDKISDSLQKPSLKNTLPIRFVIWLYHNRLFVPLFIELCKKKPEKIVNESDDDQENDELYRQLRIEEAEKKRKKLIEDLKPKKVEQPININPVSTYDTTNYTKVDTEPIPVQENSDKPWSEAEKLSLIKAIQKYPAGVTDRWLVIAQCVGRSAADCSKMEKTLKASHFKLKIDPISQVKKKSAQNEISDSIITQRSDEEDPFTTKQWSQNQQKQLEDALRQFGKEMTDRWDKIALCVDGKSKEECIQRVKQICQTIKTK